MEITIPRDGFHLGGDLVSPDGAAASGVVMIGGSGPSDRLNGGYFAPIRAHLVRQGIAVLSYDKRGVGASGGSWTRSGIRDLGDDALAALDLLESALPRSTPLALYGHSEGAWVVLSAAARAPELVDRIVTTSCPSITPGEQDRYAIGVALADSLRVHDVLAAYDHLLATDRYPAALRAYDAAPELVELIGLVTEDEWAFMRRKRHHRASIDVQRLRSAWLALYGAADRLIPVRESAAAFEPRATVSTFPSADHRLQVDGRLAPGLLETISNWLTR